MDTTEKKRSPTDFRIAAETQGITRWPHHDCAICGYTLAFIFRGDRVIFDRGCHCTKGPMEKLDSSWEEVADYYNIQTNEDVIERMNDFWNFND